MRNQAFKLIDVCNENIVVCQEGIQKIKNIKGKIIVVSAVGPALTGKSTLLNQIVDKQVFKSGHTTLPTTKGINAYVKQLKSEIFREPVWEIFLDIQGSDNPFNDSTEQIDIKLLCFAICISKIVMYNSFGALDSKTLQRLASLQGLLPQNLQSLCCFMLLQRDFSLKLTNYGNQQIKKQEYLDICLKSFKNKNQIDAFSRIFTNNIQKEKSKLKCFLLPIPQDQHEYSRSLQKLKKGILEQQIKSLSSSSSKFLSCSELIFGIMEFIQLCEHNNFTNYYIKVHQKVQKQSKNSLIAFKSTFSDRIKKDLKQHLPMPRQLLAFKLKNIYKQSLLNQLPMNSNQQNFISDLIGQQKLMNYYNKALQRLETQNKKKIRQFIQVKVHELINSYEIDPFNLENLSVQKQKSVKSLLQYYPFISQSQNGFIQLRIQTQLNQKLFHKVKSLEEQKIKNNEISEKSLHNYSSQLCLIKQKLAHKQEQLKLKQLELTTLQTQQENKLKKQIEKSEAITQAQGQMLKYQQTIKNYQKTGDQLLKKIQNQLIQSVTYQKNKSNQKPSEHTILQQNYKAILQSVNKVLLTIQKENAKVKQDQRKEFEKILNLQRMNKNLRERIQQLSGSDSCIKVLQRKFQLSQAQLLQKDKQIQRIVNQKQWVIQKLRNQINYKKQAISSLSLQLQLAKSRVTDKCKTSQFMQKLIAAKETALQQARKQLLQNISRHKQELNNVKSNFKQKQIELSGTLSMFVVQNQQLLDKNNELTNKIATIQLKLKKNYEAKLNQKQQQIANLMQNKKKLQKSMQNMNDSYQSLLNSLQISNKEKDDLINGLNIQIKSKQEKLVSTEKSLENVRQKYQIQMNRVYKLELQNQQLESKIKREQDLAKNKIRHIELSNERLKVQMKQKQSTFDLMLLQLRSQNLMNNNTINSKLNPKTASKEESRQKYMKRIDLIQQRTLKQLGEISNKSYARKNDIEKISVQQIGKQFRSDRKVIGSQNIQQILGKTYKKSQNQSAVKNLSQSFSKAANRPLNMTSKLHSNR